MILILYPVFGHPIKVFATHEKAETSFVGQLFYTYVSVLSSNTLNPLDNILGERLVELTKTLVEIPSETGKEQEMR
jgi:hypothetical protein